MPWNMSSFAVLLLLALQPAAPGRAPSEGDAIVAAIVAAEAGRPSSRCVTYTPEGPFNRFLRAPPGGAAPPGPVRRPSYRWQGGAAPDLDAAAASIMAAPEAAVMPAALPDPLPAPLQAGEGCRFTLRLSAPARSGDIAFVAVDHLCRPLCGHGELVALRRGQDGWRIADRATTWIS